MPEVGLAVPDSVPVTASCFAGANAGSHAMQYQPVFVKQDCHFLLDSKGCLFTGVASREERLVRLAPIKR